MDNDVGIQSTSLTRSCRQSILTLAEEIRKLGISYQEANLLQETINECRLALPSGDRSTAFDM